MEIGGYFDAVAAEPPSPQTLDVLRAAVQAAYADPMRLFTAARESRLMWENARAVTAECLSVEPGEVTFTGSATEAVRSGLLGLAEAVRRREGTACLAYGAVEHSSVLAACRWWWRTHGGEPPRSLPVDRFGALRRPVADHDVSRDPASALNAPHVLAVQQANGEVGTLQDLDGVLEEHPGCALFVDAGAAGARLPLPQAADVVALNPLTWGGPAGVGILVVRRRARWRPALPEDNRLDPRGAGFENVPAVLASAAALQVRIRDRAELAIRHREYADRLLRVLAGIDDVEVHGDPEARLPHIVSFSLLYLDGEALVTELDRRGLAVASGSACAAGADSPSHVLAAMGALTHGNVRVSFGWHTGDEGVEALCRALPEVVALLRARLPGGLA